MPFGLAAPPRIANRASDPARFLRALPQYIEPQDAKVLGQAELVVIDEAALGRNCDRPSL